MSIRVGGGLAVKWEKRQKLYSKNSTGVVGRRRKRRRRRRSEGGLEGWEMQSLTGQMGMVFH